MIKYILWLCAAFPLAGFAQTLSDGLMMPKKDLCTGILYSTDQWKNYWEGELKRSNENIGSLKTQTLLWVASYGVSEKLNVIAMFPYIKTKATQGTLTSLEGIQDLTVAVKYNFFRKDFTKSSVSTFGALAVSTPLSDYTPDLFPLSLGTATTNVSWRGTVFYKMVDKFYMNASGAYTWRSNTELDRPSYYTNDQLYLTNEVKMPNVFDYSISAGYSKNGLQTEIVYTQQNTLGGSDIRRQDMPFVSNRMNFSRLGALVMYYLPSPKGLAIRANVSQVVAGRNVGQSTTLMGGILYTLHLSGSTTN
jgi:hypothetical protein